MSHSRKHAAFGILMMIFALTGGSPLRAAEIHLQEEIASIPAKVSDIHLCGHWKSTNADGIYRIVYIDFYYGNSLLYIQWIRDFTLDDPARHTVHTLSIAEFNANDHIEITFDKPACVETDDGIRFSIDALSGNDETRHHYDLRVYHPFGSYRLVDETAGAPGAGDAVKPQPRSAVSPQY